MTASDLGVTVPQATSTITACAFGVVIGAPLVSMAVRGRGGTGVWVFFLGLFGVGAAMMGAIPAISTPWAKFLFLL